MIAKRLTLGLAVAAAATIPMLTVAGTAGAAGRQTPAVTKCSVTDDSWAKPVDLQPTGLKNFAPAGLYMWHDVNGWHIRVTHPSTALMTFTGSVKVPKGVVVVDKVLIKKNSTVKLSTDKRTLTFTFKNKGKQDGVDFRTQCAGRVLTGVSVDGKVLAKKSIFIGASAFHPKRNPFRFVGH